VGTLINPPPGQIEALHICTYSLGSQPTAHNTAPNNRLQGHRRLSVTSSVLIAVFLPNFKQSVSSLPFPLMLSDYLSSGALNNLDQEQCLKTVECTESNTEVHTTH
jgi:hypothetical protein